MMVDKGPGHARSRVALIRSRRGRAVAAAVSVLTLGLFAAGCSPGPSSSNAASSSSVTAESTQLPAGKVHLTMWTVQPGGTQQALKNVIAMYERAHPNITITLNYTQSTDFSNTWKLVMSSNTAPDIAECGQGYTQQGPGVQAGLILPLDKYAQLYNWQSKVPSTFLDEARLPANGSGFGHGILYGFPIAGNFDGVWYNKADLAKLGVQTPITSVADFTTALQKAKAAGYIPIMAGNGDSNGDAGEKIWENLISSFWSPTAKTNWIYGIAGSDINTAPVQQATTLLTGWIKDGYIYKYANATSRADGISDFASGKGVFTLNGNWFLTNVATGLGNNGGFMLFPPAQAGAPLRAAGATSQPWCISSKSKYPNVAANFLNFAGSAATAQTLFNGGFLPIVGLNSVKVQAGTPAADVLSAWKQLVQGGKLTLWSDWPTPSMQTVLDPTLQELFGGKASVSSLLTAVQANWASFQASK